MSTEIADLNILGEKFAQRESIGDQTELRRLGIRVVQHLPGVGHGFQDHPVVGCVWECSEPLAPDVAPDAVLFWKSGTGLESPDFQILQAILSAEDAAKLGLPASGCCASPLFEYNTCRRFQASPTARKYRRCRSSTAQFHSCRKSIAAQQNTVLAGTPNG